RAPGHGDQILGAIAECSGTGAFGRNHERQRVYPESADAQLEPGFDDSGDLCANGWIAGVQIRLMIVESVIVILAGLVIEGPRPLLDARKNHTLLDVLWFFFRPYNQSR